MIRVAVARINNENLSSPSNFAFAMISVFHNLCKINSDIDIVFIRVSLRERNSLMNWWRAIFRLFHINDSILITTMRSVMSPSFSTTLRSKYRGINTSLTTRCGAIFSHRSYYHRYLKHNMYICIHICYICYNSK